MVLVVIVMLVMLAVYRQGRHGSSYHWSRWRSCTVWRRQQSLDV